MDDVLISMCEDIVSLRQSIYHGYPKPTTSQDRYYDLDQYEDDENETIASNPKRMPHETDEQTHRDQDRHVQEQPVPDLR